MLLGQGRRRFPAWWAPGAACKGLVPGCGGGGGSRGWLLGLEMDAAHPQVQGSGAAALLLLYAVSKKELHKDGGV